MKFTEILEELRKGKKVTREKWEEPDCTIDFIVYGQNKGNFLLFYNGNCYRFNFNNEDIVAEDWKLYKEKKTNKKWKPQYGEKYYTISTRGTIDFDNFVAENNTDAVRLLLGNVFETEEEAKHMLEKIKIINKLRELSNVDFNEDFDEQKWYITYNHRTKSIECDTTYHVQRMPFCIYFKNQEDCGKAIDTIGEDNLKKYYFDIVEEDK